MSDNYPVEVIIEKVSSYISSEQSIELIKKRIISQKKNMRVSSENLASLIFLIVLLWPVSFQKSMAVLRLSVQAYCMMLWRIATYHIRQ